MSLCGGRVHRTMETDRGLNVCGTTFPWCVIALCLLTACASPESPPDAAGRVVECVDPRPQMCTMDYAPVCATLSNAARQPYPNGCAACADPEVTGYIDGPCPTAGQ